MVVIASFFIFIFIKVNDMVIESLSKKIKAIDIVLIGAIILSSIVPLLSIPVYFRGDDIEWLEWAKFHHNPLTVFNPLDNENLMMGCYRPIINIIWYILFHIFGLKLNSFPYQVSLHLFFIGSLIYLYKIAKLIFTKKIAFFSISLFHLCFYFILHILTWCSYISHISHLFFITASIFHFIKGMKWKDKRGDLTIGIILSFIAFLSNIQSILIIPIVITTYLISYYKEIALIPKNKICLVIGIIIVPVIYVLFLHLVPLSRMSDLLSAKSLFEILQVVGIRYNFYMGELTNGISEIIISFTTMLFIIYKFSEYLKVKWEKYLLFYYGLIVIIVSLILLDKITGFSILFLSLFIAFIIDKKVRFCIAWTFIGFFPLLSQNLYVNGYLLEMSYGLSIFMGVSLMTFYQDIVKVAQKIKRYNVRWKIIIYSITLFITGYACFYIFTIVLSKINNLNYFKDTQGNFREVIEYLEEHIPFNDTIYALKTDQSESSIRKMRRGPARIQIDRQKAMSLSQIDKLLDMVGRSDIKVKSINNIDSIAKKDIIGKYLIVLTPYEKGIVEKEIANREYPYLLKIIREIRRGETIAVIYTII
ncbi:MAG: hypothetical protein AB1414_04185 [bacterium]